jgi:hypothetical protein
MFPFAHVNKQIHNIFPYSRSNKQIPNIAALLATAAVFTVVLDVRETQMTRNSQHNEGNDVSTEIPLVASHQEHGMPPPEYSPREDETNSLLKLACGLVLGTVAITKERSKTKTAPLTIP